MARGRWDVGKLDCCRAEFAADRAASRARADRGAGRSRGGPTRRGVMNALVIMIPLSLALVAGAVWAVFWAVDNDQFEDLETPGLLPLDDTHSDEPGA